MKPHYPLLFSPGNISGIRLRNRIIMSAMSTNFAGETGSVTPKLINYYRERAKGGPGMIIIENTNVDYPSGKCGAVQLRVDDNRFMPGLYELVTAIHDQDCKVALQINHGGITAKPDRLSGGEVVAPSAIEYPGRSVLPKELEVSEIRAIALRFAEAAARAQKVGFDAVEVHGAHGYLLSEFLSPVMNRRKDEYGGSLLNRMRFPLLVMEMVREAVGQDYPVLFRMSGDEFNPGGNGLTEAIEIAKKLEKAGVSAIHVTAGTQLTPYSRASVTEPMSFTQGWKVYMAAAIKKEVSIPVIAVGVIRQPAFAENVLSEQSADFVALGRAFIADPYWPKKAKEGRDHEIQRCISCRFCSSRRNFLNLPIACTVNPLTGREAENESVYQSAPRPKKVFVAGGGPAGMKAAETAAQRGHRVTLWEKEPSLGGQLKIAAKPPGKEKLTWAKEDLISTLQLSGVKVCLGEELTTAILEKEKPDAVIIACGSVPSSPLLFVNAPAGMVYTARELLEGSINPAGKTVAVIGGGSVGCETAHFLVEHLGAKAVVIEQENELARELEAISRQDLLKNVTEAGVTTLTNTNVRAIREEGVLISNSEGESLLEAGLVVLAVGAVPSNQLAEAADKLVAELYVVGDNLKPGRIYEAVQSGFRAGLKV